MFEKGSSFLGAAILLRQNGGYGYVVLHLICQGVENVMKAFLLIADYDQYQPRLRRRSAFGHDLEKLVTEVVSEFKVKARHLGQAESSELKELNAYYSTHLLRYGTMLDLLRDPSMIGSGRVLRKMLAVVRIARRHLYARPLPDPEGFPAVAGETD